MKIISDTGMVFPDAQVGTKIHPKYKHRIQACSVDRSEIILFTAKGGVWFEYARHFREFLFKNKTQEIFIKEDR